MKPGSRHCEYATTETPSLQECSLSLQSRESHHFARAFAMDDARDAADRADARSHEDGEVVAGEAEGDGPVRRREIVSPLHRGIVHVLPDIGQVGVHLANL